MTPVNQTLISSPPTTTAEKSYAMHSSAIKKPVVLGREAAHTPRQSSPNSPSSGAKSNKVSADLLVIKELSSFLGSTSMEDVKPLRFQDLPPEIRNEIYRLVLCNFHRTPKLTKNQQLLICMDTQLSYLTHKNDYNILRANRAIHNEAQYAMRKTNLFVKIVLNIPFEEDRSPIQGTLIAFSLQVMWLCECRASSFSDCVLIHEISGAKHGTYRVIPMNPTIFVILGRDLDRWVAALENFTGQFYEKGYYLAHKVTLVDPYAGDTIQAAEPFHPDKLQEAMLKPYRKLRGFSDFEIHNVPEHLRKAALADITHMPKETPEQIIAHFEAMKERANTVYKSGDSKLAAEMYAEVIIDMINTTRGRRADPLFNAPTGGPDFANRLSNLHFILCSNRVQCYLNRIREWVTDGLNRDPIMFLKNIINASEESSMLRSQTFRKSTFEPSDKQVSKILYKQGIACRLVGSLCSLERGVVVIGEAMRRCPDDPILVEEWKKIQACIARLSGSHFVPVYRGDSTMLS